jgi:hypothetical protein
MNEHQYILEKYKGNNRFSCPGCGNKKEFTRYINAEGNYIADHVGICNRADKCGHHFTPKQYFEANGVKPEFKPIQKPEPVKEMFTIPLDWMDISLTNYSQNSFAVNLLNYFGEIEATRLLTLYQCIGTSLKYPGAVIFWQLDINGNVRTGKIMKYRPDFHREKFVKWVHYNHIPKHQELRQCFFGEHLLRDKTKPVSIVESEKTAVICSHYLPEYIWLAAGNLQGLTEMKMRPLRDRDVIFFPDLGAGFIEWTKKANEFKHIAKIKVSCYLESMASEEQKKEGFDLADFLLRKNEYLIE